VTSTQRAAWAATGVLLAVLVGSDGVVVAAGVVVVAGAVGAGLVGAGLVGVGDAVGEVAESAGVALFDALLVAEGFAVLVVVEGVGEVDVGVGGAEGLGLDDGAGNRSGSHDCLPVTVAALAVIAARVASETVVSRTLPATRATAAGRGCTNRMKNAHRCCSLLLGTAHSATPVLTRLARIITAGGEAAGLLPAGGHVCPPEGINERTVRLQPPCVACRVHFCDALRAEREASGAVTGQGTEAGVR
jgi:hypothetical protein